LAVVLVVENDANNSFDPTQFFAPPLKYPKDLSAGMTDPDVKRLQVQLNTNPTTKIATTGAGSRKRNGVLWRPHLHCGQKVPSAASDPHHRPSGPLTRAALSAGV
jgi:hypothetical protein